jgi:hypothetical protein
MREIAGVGNGKVERLRSGVRLQVKPVKGAEDKDDGNEIEQSANGKYMGTPVQEPDGAWKHDENAKPGDLADGASDGVGKTGAGKPREDGVVVFRLKGAKAGVKAEDNEEEATDIRHEGDSEWQENGAENEGESGDGGVSGIDAGADKGAMG